MIPAAAEQVFASVGRKSTLDAATGLDGCDFTCNLLSPAKRPFLRLDPAGHCVWIAPPATRLLPFLRHYLAARARVPATSAHSHVVLADGGTQTILGQVTVRLCLGPLRIQLHPYVLPHLSPSTGFLLGAASLSALQATVDLSQRVLRLRKDALVYRAPFLHEPSAQAVSVNYAALQHGPDPRRPAPGCKLTTAKGAQDPALRALQL